MFANSELKNLSQEINQVARASGSIIREFFQSSYNVDIKDDKSPVTTADLAANDHIEQQLDNLTPDIPRISEESDNISYEIRKHWDTFWLIDPLDGTREFIKNRPDFTVNIALIHHNRPILGSIYLPISDQLYYSTVGNSAYRCDQSGEPITITVTDSTHPTPRICGSRAHHGKLMQAFLDNVGKHELIARGSSIKSCLVADGSADIYPRFGPTWEWDTAAAQCIIEQSGGHMTTLDMNALLYNKESLLNPSFLAFGNKNTDWKTYITT
ncbi:MAG: 3'(2'),5'-bisphosphate nucleotidase CysQ [Gammaproteobacteria bacterium]|nr:3'(2'),5'-bisphosphate nucleotidase CysQ [Gammaproteobacteria bacterium]